MQAAGKTNDSGREQQRAQSVPLNRPVKTKRTLTIGHFFMTLGKVFASCPGLVKALMWPKISAALRENVFLGVTSISNCRYCSWGQALPRQVWKL
jgi:hypothetical protein